MTADSERNPPALVPNTCVQSHPSTKYSGGLGSLALQVCSIAPSDSRISWTAWASSNHRLCCVSVAKRSAAATTTSAPTIIQSASGRPRAAEAGDGAATAPCGELTSTLTAGATLVGPGAETPRIDGEEAGVNALLTGRFVSAGGTFGHTPRYCRRLARTR